MWKLEVLKINLLLALVFNGQCAPQLNWRCLLQKYAQHWHCSGSQVCSNIYIIAIVVHLYWGWEVKKHNIYINTEKDDWNDPEMIRTTCEIILEGRAENKSKKIMDVEVQNSKVLKHLSKYKSLLYSFATCPRTYIITR